MERYYILDKEKIKKGEFYFLGVYDTEEEIPKSEIPTIMFKAELPPRTEYQFYDEIDDKIKNKPLTKLVEEGHLKLSIGQKIVGDVIHEYEQLSKYHIWNGEEWIINIEQVKLQKREELKSIRDEKISEDIEVDGAVYQIKEKDLQKFLLKKVEADIHPELKEVKEDWRLADNTYKKINFNDVLNILEAYGARQRKVFKEFALLEYQVNNCDSIEKIEAIKWE